jgi:Ser/Thr protein kinase RdoA (MazF antagonist)
VEALRHYDFDRPRVVRAFASERNDNVLVEDAGGRCVVVRHYRRNQDPERIEFQLDVQQHLAACGVPKADVIRTRSGARVAPGQARWLRSTAGRLAPRKWN